MLLLLLHRLSIQSSLLLLHRHSSSFGRRFLRRRWLSKGDSPRQLLMILLLRLLLFLLQLLWSGSDSTRIVR